MKQTNMTFEELVEFTAKELEAKFNRIKEVKGGTKYVFTKTYMLREGTKVTETWKLSSNDMSNLYGSVNSTWKATSMIESPKEMYYRITGKKHVEIKENV